MLTLIKIVKLINGYERHYRIEGTNKLWIEFVERPISRVKGA
jgi:hypothetical protein